MSSTGRSFFAVALALSACGSPPPAQPTQPTEGAASPAVEPTLAARPDGEPTLVPTLPPTAPPTLVDAVGGAAFFAERGLRGVLVLRTAEEPAIRVVGDRAVATQRFVPASTFKVPSTLIGLETGAIPDASLTLAWDGTEREITAWNRDHDLRSAMQESVVWYYQEVARRVGIDPMRSWVARLEYGSAETGDVVDRFWLDGPLVISPIEQIAFLHRLTRGELPVSERSVGILHEIMVRRAQGDATILGKTGTHQDAETQHAWLVGWVERGGEATAWFALLLLPERSELGDQLRLRWDLALELLAREGAIPEA